jgi:hypothetical protein
MHPLELKVALATRGARLDPAARDQVALRSGGGLAVELALADGISVGVPVDEAHAATSPFELVPEGRGVLIRRRDASVEPIVASTVPYPRFAGRKTSRGTPMARVAHRIGRHVVVHPGAACGFSVRGTPCAFCLEGARPPAERDAAPVSDVLEVVRAARDEGGCEVVYFNSGVFDADDGGMGFLAPYVEAVRRHFDVLIATQVHPPRTLRWVDRAYALGVDALSYNLEVFDETHLQRHCVGRARYIGRERYLDALRYAATVFPSGTVWTELVVGLEPAASTRAGIDALAAMGVVPVLGFAGAVLDPDDVAPLLAQLYRAVKEQGTPMTWVRDLLGGITPLEARHFAGDGSRLGVTDALVRSRLGGLAARGLARVRRRLRVRPAVDAAP